jgi:predicted secreted hydrolase
MPFLRQASVAVLVALATISHVSAEWIQPPTETAEGYRVPQPFVAPTIPAAHGAHREYAIEWWYWVGHLQTVEGAHELGFQSTVFRLAGDSSQAATITGDALAANQVYMSHSALSDLTDRKYTNTERIYREGWQAQSATGYLDLRVGAISAQELEGEDGFSKTILYPDGMELRLKMYPVKLLTAFGDRGLSRKGGDPAAVSWYWTYTRLKVEGEWIQGGTSQAVEGYAWMDHEISSSQLGSDLEGWDWTAIQLYDGTEVKAYRLRTNEGGSDPWSAVYWIDAEGGTRSVYAKDFTWENGKLWTSEATGITYPTTVTIRATDPADGSTKIYKLRPFLDEQEFTGNTGSNPYWEGACEVLDAENNVIGRAYLELAGYGGGLGSILQ